ncbi:MAG: HNH endonuclease [Methanomicrobiales archaeon]|nr:HNH endonuclease [Methanomicrobiales archaeon]
MPNLNQKIPTAKMPGFAPPRAPLPAPKGVSGEGDWERITPAIQAKVWKKRFGFRKTGICVCCHQRTIFRDEFVCGHRRSYAGGGGNDVGNLEPICGRCHEKMGTHDLVSWCRKFQEELRTVKPMPKTTTTKKPVRKATAKKPASKTAAVKKTVRTTAKKSASKTAAVKKTVRRTTAKKSASKKAKR